MLNGPTGGLYLQSGTIVYILDLTLLDLYLVTTSVTEATDHLSHASSSVLCCGLHLPPSYLYPESGLVPVPHLHNIQATNWGQVAGVDLSCHFLEHVFTVPFSGACIVGFIAVCEIVADRHVQIWRHVENDCLRSLIHAFITSRLDYCNSLYARCNASVLQRLQRVQNCAVRYILNAPPRSPSLPLLHHLHWLPIESRICYKLCSLMYRVNHNTAALYLSELRVPCSDTRLRSTTRGNYIIPKTHRHLTNRVFVVAAPVSYTHLTLPTNREV